MDFDSPDVMKDFPGLYASELNKKCSNDSDCKLSNEINILLLLLSTFILDSDDSDTRNKKDILIGKRKDKKDKKDKERGYAALEGESSDDASKSRYVLLLH